MNRVKKGLKPRSWRYAPLILVAPLALVFIPMGIQVYLFFFPVAAALGAAYLGTIAGAYWQRRLGSIASDPDAAKRRQEQFRDFSNRFLLPLSLGFAGMFLSMFSLFFGFMLGLEFPLYVVAYPLIYAAMGALLGMKTRIGSAPRSCFACCHCCTGWCFSLLSTASISKPAAGRAILRCCSSCWQLSC